MNLPLGRRATFLRRLTPLFAATALLATLGANAVDASQRNARHGRARARTSSVPRALSAAARRSARADRALVSDANRVALCARSGRRGDCRAMHAAVQRAGRRLARAQRRFGQLARAGTGAPALGAGTGARSAAVDPSRRAPQLTISGETLSWAPKPSIGTYVLQRSVPGQETQFSLVRGDSVTPPPVPGVTVSYSVRTARNDSPWSAWKSIDYPASSAGSEASRGRQARQAAPSIAVSGQTLSWNRVDGVDVYVLESKAPGKAETYSVVVGTSTTPTVEPGATVHYTVRTAVEGSAWAPEVAIAYAGQGERGSAGQGEHGSGSREEEQKQKSSPEKPPLQPPAPESREEAPIPPFGGEAPRVGETEAPFGDPNLQPGINDGQNVKGGDLQAALILGAKVVRVGFSIGASVAELEPVIGGYAANGIRVAPLAEFYGAVPTPAQAQNLGSWARSFGPGGSFWNNHPGGQFAIRTIEFGNETASGEQYGIHKGEAAYTRLAQTYAIRFKEAGEAIEAGGVHVGLLAQEDDETGDWINGMYSAVPNLTKWVAGWEIHPYGGEGYNRDRLALLISQTAAHGGSAIPIDATEWGVSTDNGACVNFNEGLNPCMTYEEAARELRFTISWIASTLGSRLGDFFVYQTGDQDLPGQSNDWQGYFGVLQHNLAPKGPYTAEVEALLSS